MRERMHVRIVPMNADHLDEVAELERICFSTPWSRNMLAEELDNALSAFLVALDDDGRVVGYAGLQVVLDEGYITNVAVRPECRRNGIAAKLLQVFLDFAQANGLSFLTWRSGRPTTVPSPSTVSGASAAWAGGRITTSIPRRMPSS